MGTTSLVVADELFSLATERTIQPDEFKSMREVPTFFADDAFKSVVTLDGGRSIDIPYIFERHSQPTSMTWGTQYRVPDTFNQPQMKSGSDGWMWIVQPMFFGGIDRNYYDSKDKQIDKVKVITADVWNHLHESFEEAALRGTTSSGSYTANLAAQQWAGLNPINGTDFASGLIEEDASGGNTIHGISRSSYPVTTYKRFHPVASDVGNSASTNLLDRLVTMELNFKQRGGNMQRAEVYGHPDGILQLNKVLRPFSQYTSMESAKDTYGVPRLLGKEVKPVTLPVNGANTGTDPWSFLGVTWGKGGLAHVRHKNWNMRVTKWEKIPGTAECQMAMVLIQAQNILFQPGSNFLIHSANQYS